MYNNDDWRQGRPNIPDYEKINKRSFWQRYRWIIISAVSVVLVLFFATTTLYLLLNRPTGPSTQVAVPRPTQAVATPAPANAAPTQAPTGQASLSATPSSSAPQPTTNLSPTSTNYQFICLADCRGKIGVTLTSININASAQTMLWNFNITNNGDCGNIYGSLSLASPTDTTISANDGTFTQSIDFNAGQTLPRSASFSIIPNHNTPYTVTLHMTCSNNYSSDDYQAVLFNY